MNNVLSSMSPIKSVLAGNWLLVVCSVAYLAWWLITFRPPEPKGSTIGSMCLILAFLSGIAGLFMAGRGMTADVEKVNAGGPMLSIIAGGVVAYAVFLAVSVVSFHRRATSELLIIMFWGTLEICILNFVSRMSVISKEYFWMLSVIVLTAVLADLACYLVYYRVPYEVGYIVGCVPLILAGAVIAVINTVILR